MLASADSSKANAAHGTWKTIPPWTTLGKYKGNGKIWKHSENRTEMAKHGNTMKI